MPEISLPSDQRAQGIPGARCTRGLVCKMCKRKRTRAYRFSGGNPAFPAQWFYGLYRALPGDRACLTPSPREYGFVRPVGLAKPPRDLTPTAEASGPHDFAVRSSTVRLRSPIDRSRIDKTRPAIAPCARALPRPPLPVPTFVTMANAPLSGRDGKSHRLICTSEKPKYFCQRDWTGQITLIRLDKLDFWRNAARSCGKTQRSPVRANQSLAVARRERCPL